MRSHVTAREGLRVAAAVARRPSLWLTALHQYWIVVPRRWWTRQPFLPVPARDYVEFRLQTQYGTAEGSGQHHIVPEDVLNYLSWCRLQRAVGS
jgi:hypothetical protein